MQKPKNYFFNYNNDINISLSPSSQETDLQLFNIPEKKEKSKDVIKLNLNPCNAIKKNTKNGLLSKKRKLSKPTKERKSYSKKRIPSKLKNTKNKLLLILNKCKRNIISFITNRVENRFTYKNFRLSLERLDQMHLEKALEKELSSFFDEKEIGLSSILSEEKKRDELIHILNELFKMKLKEIF